MRLFLREEKLNTNLFIQKEYGSSDQFKESSDPKNDQIGQLKSIFRKYGFGKSLE